MIIIMHSGVCAYKKYATCVKKNNGGEVTCRSMGNDRPVAARGL